MKPSLVKPYHKKADVSFSRPDYREGRWGKAVKVYTINQESRYLIIQNVPCVGASKELVELFALYGDIEEYRFLNDYPTEEFTEVYWIKYKRIQSARFGKRKLDNHSFFGGQLHVCYAPEYETVDDVRNKLNERKRLILRKCSDYANTKEHRTETDKEFENHKNEVNLPVSINEGGSSKTIPVEYTLPSSTPGNEQISQASAPIFSSPVVPCKPDKTLPYIATAQATLPLEIQQLTASEIYPNTFDRSMNSLLSNQHVETSKFLPKHDEKTTEKRIVWNNKRKIIESTGTTVSVLPSKPTQKRHRKNDGRKRI